MIPKAEIFENPGPTHSNLVVIRMSTFHFIAPVPHDLRIGQIVYRIHPSHSSNFSAAFPIVLCLQPSARFHKLSKWAFVQVKHTVECLDIMPPCIWTILVSHLVFSFCSFSRLTLTSCAPREGGLQARDSERGTLLRAADQDSKHPTQMGPNSPSIWWSTVLSSTTRSLAPYHRPWTGFSPTETT